MVFAVSNLSEEGNKLGRRDIKAPDGAPALQFLNIVN